MLNSQQPRMYAPRSTRRYQFWAPEDTPKHTRFVRTANGFKAETPIPNLGGTLLGYFLGMGAFVIGCGRVISMHHLTMESLYFMLVGLYVILIGTFYATMKQVLIVEGDDLKAGRSAFGLNFVRVIPWKRLTRLSIPSIPSSTRFLETPSNYASGPKIRVETANLTIEFGSRLTDVQRHYFRYLIEYQYKSWRKTQPATLVLGNESHNLLSTYQVCR